MKNADERDQQIEALRNLVPIAVLPRALGHGGVGEADRKDEGEAIAETPIASPSLPCMRAFFVVRAATSRLSGFAVAPTFRLEPQRRRVTCRFGHFQGTSSQ